MSKLNRLVAQKVFNSRYIETLEEARKVTGPYLVPWHVAEDGHTQTWIWRNKDNDQRPVRWSPDTNIADAWEVVEHVIKGRHVRCMIMLGSHMQPNAEFFDVATGQMRYSGSAATMPEAISLAALRAVGVPDAEIQEALR